MSHPDYDKTLAIFRDLTARHDIDLKGKTMPYISMNGNMFGFLGKAGLLCLRLAPDVRKTFMSAQNLGPVKQHGRIMKDYVGVPPEIITDTPALDAIFAQSLAFAQTLKPKPTKARKTQ